MRSDATDAEQAAMTYLTCPSCRLSLRTRFASLPVEYCPRCLARRRTAVALRYANARLQTPRRAQSLKGADVDVRHDA
jgi:Zn-finger nucleic acid-binding protein